MITKAELLRRFSYIPNEAKLIDVEKLGDGSIVFNWVFAELIVIENVEVVKG